MDWTAVLFENDEFTILIDKFLFIKLLFGHLKILSGFSSFLDLFIKSFVIHVDHRIGLEDIWIKDIADRGIHFIFIFSWTWLIVKFNLSCWNFDFLYYVISLIIFVRLIFFVWFWAYFLFWFFKFLFYLRDLV